MLAILRSAADRLIFMPEVSACISSKPPAVIVKPFCAIVEPAMVTFPVPPNVTSPTASSTPKVTSLAVIVAAILPPETRSPIANDCVVSVISPSLVISPLPLLAEIDPLAAFNVTEPVEVIPLKIISLALVKATSPD